MDHGGEDRRGQAMGMRPAASSAPKARRQRCLRVDPGGRVRVRRPKLTLCRHRARLHLPGSWRAPIDAALKPWSRLFAIQTLGSARRLRRHSERSRTHELLSR